MNFSKLIIITFTFALAACASHEPKPPKTQESFVTLIKRDGTKQFSYALVMDLPDSDKRGGGGKHGGHGGGHGGPGGGGHDGPPPGDRDHSHGDKKSGDENAVDDHFNFLFDEGLVAKLGDTGFCRQGYKQLDKKNRLGAIQVSGECNDAASDEDKTKFPNPSPKQIKEESIE